MFRVVRIAVLVGVALGLSAVEAVAGSSVTIPLPWTLGDMFALVPAGARTVEFLAGLIAGILIGEFARFAWMRAKSLWAASLDWGTHALRYGTVVALLFCLIFFV